MSDDESLPIEILSVSTDDSSKARDVEFADVVEKLTFAIDNVNKLKPWKDRALKAEALNRKLSLTISKLKDELSDTQYELQKWKKRAVRAEQENQAEIQKWKQKVKNARESRTELLDNEEEDLIINVDDGSFTNLVTERDEAEDNSTISTFKDEMVQKKANKQVKAKPTSFRDKWKNLDFDEKSNDRSSKDEGSTTVVANDIVLQYEAGIFKKENTSEEGSASANEAEDILNNYLSMKGRFNSRRFDSSGKKVSSPKIGKKLEL